MEPRLTATSVIRSPCYYGHFFGAIWQNGHTFSCKPVDMAKFLGLLVTVLMGFHCTMYIIYCTHNLPCDSRHRKCQNGKRKGIRGKGKREGVSPSPSSLPPTPPPLPQKQKPYYEQENIWIVVTCTEDQEICAISGRNGIVWQIINHVISHSLFLCTYYLIEVPAKYSC